MAPAPVPLASAPLKVKDIDVGSTASGVVDDRTPIYGIFVESVPSGFSGTLGLRIGGAKEEAITVYQGWARRWDQPIVGVYFEVTAGGSGGTAQVTVALMPVAGTPPPQVNLMNVNSALLDSVFGSTRGSFLERGASGWALFTPSGANKVMVDGGPGADPAWTTLSALIDAAIGSTRGAVLYRGAAGWAILAPGTAGLPLESGGGGADPSYGTVANAALANMANATLKGRKTAGAGAPEDISVSDALNFLAGAADGDIVSRTGGAWARLGIGAALKVLMSDGSVPAWTYIADLTNAAIKLKQFSETPVAKGNLGATPSFDLSAGSVFTGTNNVATAPTFDNAIAARGNSFTVILTNGGAFAITWPASVKWAGGVAPALTAAGVDVLTFTSPDGGTTWYGFLGGLAFA